MFLIHTADEAWGPHGSLMNEIADATFVYEEYSECMAMVWKRVLKDSNKGENWRRIYKVAMCRLSTIECA